MADYYTADLHLGHPLVASLRGFGTSKADADTAAHDQTIIDRWHATISHDDTIWILGDLVGHNHRYQHALDILDTLPGTKRLIAGNHDVVAALHRRSHRHQRHYLNTFDSVQDYATTTLPVTGPLQPGQSGKRRILLSHYPYLGPGDDHTTEARYAQVRLPDHGTPLLHGHTHNPDQRLHHSPTGTPQIHVGLDAWNLTPVPAHTLANLLPPPPHQPLP